MSLGSHMGKVFLETAAVRFSAYCEWQGVLSEPQCRVRPSRSTIDTMYVVRRLEELTKKEKIFDVRVLHRPENAFDPLDSSLL